MFTFPTAYEAQEFCYENSTDVDHYICEPISHTIESLGYSFELTPIVSPEKQSHMKIREEDFEPLLKYLHEKRWDGYEFMVFPVNTPLTRENIIPCFTHEEAMSLCNQTSNATNEFNQTYIRTVYRTMSEGLADNKLMRYDGDLVNVSQMIEDHIERLQIKPISDNIKTTVMNEKNFDYLKEQIKLTGFGEGFEETLKKSLEKKGPDFTLAYNKQFGNDQVDVQLHFNKSKQSDMYFFNKYTVAVKPEKGQTVEQTFFIGKENNFTFKEAFNLMSGRAVNKDLHNKEGQVYNAWVKMDFKQPDDNGNYKMQHYHQNYGFKLEEALAKYPIKELQEETQKARLLSSIRKGNLQSVTLVVDNKETKYFIEANPQFKTINVYNENMQRISNKQENRESQSASQKESAKQSPTEEEETNNKKNSKKRGQTI